MRGLTAMVGVLMATCFSTVGYGQVYRFATPPPRITAVDAAWQLSGEPVLFAGDSYSPTAERVFFDGNVMAEVGVYRGVPLYADTTVEPYSIIYVPIGSDLMRRYERPRTGALGGTEGSRLSWFPIGPTPSGPAASEVPPQPLGTRGSLGSVPGPTVAGESPAAEIADARRSSSPARTIIATALRPESNRGIWISYDGARWYPAGKAVDYQPDQFVPIGMYFAFPVYRAIDRRPDEIYIPAVEGGALTPYIKR
jgi:hypothetical protein